MYNKHQINQEFIYLEFKLNTTFSCLETITAFYCLSDFQILLLKNTAETCLVFLQAVIFDVKIEF